MVGNAFVFNSSRGCAIFLENNNQKNLSFMLGNFEIDVPYESSSLINCSVANSYTEVYSSAKVRAPAQHRVVKEAEHASIGEWMSWPEPKQTSE